MNDFEWPWQYNFPPFFTIQPNLATRAKQLEAWKELILTYHRTQKKYILDVAEVQSSPLFSNKEIKRSLPLDGIYAVLEDLQKQGQLEWTDKQKQRCYIYWRTPEEWGSLIYNWASSHGMTNTVCTLFELTNGDDTADEEFHELDTGLLLKSLRTLENEGKAEVISFDGNEGVKFF